MTQAEQFPEPSEEDALNPTATPAAADTVETDIVLTLQAELNKAKDQLLRALADAENTRKRALKDREDAGKYAIAAFARDLLDFGDNFHRALTSIPTDLKDVDDRVASVISGIEAMEEQLLKNFEKHGIQKIIPLDMPFDPNFHEVMFEVPGTGKPTGTVVQVIEPGYVIKDRLLRPARVGVARDEGQSSTGPGNRVDQQV